LIIVWLSSSLFAQRFNDFNSIPENLLKETLQNKKKLCELSPDQWVNAPLTNMEREHKGKFTIVHFTSFDNYTSNANVEDLTRLQKEFPYIRVILALNSKYDFPQKEKDILFELEKRQLPLPVYVDRGFELWQCMSVEYWPTTLFFGPKGALLESHEGRLNLAELRSAMPKVINRLAPYLDKNAEQFYGMPPGRWNKRTVLEYPAGLAVNKRENMVFVSDQIGDRILGLTLAGNVIFCIGNGEPGYLDGSMEEAKFNGPLGMAMDEENFILYVADTDNHAVRKVDLVNNKVSTVLGNGTRSSKKLKKVLGTNGAIDAPSDLVLHQDFLYISMRGSNQIMKMDLRTEVASVIAGSSDFGFSEESTKKAQLASPSGLAFDVSGALFFTENQASAIRYVDDKELNTVVGSGVFEYGYNDGKKDEIKMRFPNGIAMHDGKLFVADTYNNCIREVEPFKRKSKTLTGDHQKAGYRNGSEPLFNQPMDVEVIGEQLIIADAANGAIRTYNFSTGEVSSITLVNHACIGRGRGKGQTDLRDGAELILGNGLNQITYSIDLGEKFELDPTAFQSVDLNTRTPGFELIDHDFNDGSLGISFMPDSTTRRQAFSLVFSLFIRSKDQPYLQFRKEISFFHKIDLSDEVGFDHNIVTPYDPSIGRK